MRIVIMLLFICQVAQMRGQDKTKTPQEHEHDAVPNNPSTQSEQPVGPSTDLTHELSPKPYTPNLVRQFGTTKHRPLLDRGFILISAFAVGATSADVESTEYGLSKGFREGNPVVGEHPSRAKLYGISLSADAAVIAWSYEFKKTQPHVKRWMIPLCILGAAHSVAGGINLVRAVSSADK